MVKSTSAVGFPRFSIEYIFFSTVEGPNSLKLWSRGFKNYLRKFSTSLSFAEDLRPGARVVASCNSCSLRSALLV